MKYSLRILPRAHADAREIAEYIGSRSAEGMIAWLDAYERAEQRIVTNPLVCGRAPEDGCIAHELLQVLFSTKSGLTYRALFIVDSDEVLILRVRGPGQRLLKKRDLPLR